MFDWKFILKKWVLRQYRPRLLEPEVRKALRQFHGKLFVDIGASVGFYSTMLSKNFERIYAFEPNPNVIPLLTNHLAKKMAANVKVFQMALGNTTGSTVLYLDPHVGFEGSVDSILPIFDYRPNYVPSHAPDHVYVGRNGIEVPLSTYDAIVRERADLIKIDVEGAEFLVLEGMKNSIRNRRVNRLLVELHNRDRKLELEALLQQYHLKWVDSDHLLGILKLDSEMS